MVEGQPRRFFAAEEIKLLRYAEPRIKAAVGKVNENAHLNIARQYGVVPENGQQTDDPGMFRHVWMWFQELCETRAFDGMSGLHHAITNLEIAAWSDLNNQPIAAHELRLIRTMDRIFIREERSARAEKSQQSKTSAPPKRKRLAYS